MNYLVVIMLFINVSFTFAQSRSEIFTFKDSSKKINVSNFINNLEASINDSTVGFGILVTQSEKPIFQKTGGFRITPADDKSGTGVPFDLSTRMHVASVTKTITAVALIKLLDEKEISINDPFEKYLPSFWKVHPSFHGMSIETLMRMKSGIKAKNDAFTSSYDSLKIIIEKGVNKSDTGKFYYANSNYALLKIVVAYLAGYKELTELENYDRNDPAINNTFIKYINENLFRPAGILSVVCHSTETNPTLMYPFPYKNEFGFLTGKGEHSINGDNLTNYVGGLGLQLSVNELSKFINTLLYTDKILSDQSLIHLTSQKFPFSKRKGSDFYYSYAMGLWIEGTETANYYGGVNAIAFCVPDKIVITIFVNSWDENAPLLNKKILKAFERALEAK